MTPFRRHRTLLTYATHRLYPRRTDVDLPNTRQDTRFLLRRILNLNFVRIQRRNLRRITISRTILMSPHEHDHGQTTIPRRYNTITNGRLRSPLTHRRPIRRLRLHRKVNLRMIHERIATSLFGRNLCLLVSPRPNYHVTRRQR